MAATTEPLDWNEPTVQPQEVDGTVASEPLLLCVIHPPRIGALRIAPSSFEQRFVHWAPPGPLSWD
jgi:hypothetical protein